MRLFCPPFRTMHYPPESASITLVAKMIACIKQVSLLKYKYKSRNSSLHPRPISHSMESICSDPSIKLLKEVGEREDIFQGGMHNSQKIISLTSFIPLCTAQCPFILYYSCLGRGKQGTGRFHYLPFKRWLPAILC